MQQVQLYLEHDNFFCPVTGHPIVGPEHFEPSDATAFVYLDEVGDFEHIQDRFAKINEKVNTEEAMEEDPFEQFKRFCDALEDMPSIVVFSLTTMGMACGPVSSTVHIGIDMNYGSKEED